MAFLSCVKCEGVFADTKGDRCPWCAFETAAIAEGEALSEVVSLRSQLAIVVESEKECYASYQQAAKARDQALADNRRLREALTNLWEWADTVLCRSEIGNRYIAQARSLLAEELKRRAVENARALRNDLRSTFPGVAPSPAPVAGPMEHGPRDELEALARSPTTSSLRVSP